VQSLLDQKFDREFEILIVDNDPDSDVARHLLEGCPGLRERNFRYFVNFENISMFGNWNRCLELARGEWVTILNDDDLLDADYLKLAFAAVDRNPAMDGIVCRKRYLDMRGGATPGGPAPLHMVWRRRIAWLIRFPLYAWHFGGARTRQLRARHFFWGPVAGTPLGFVFRRRCALVVGGFYPEEHPASDLWFYARFSSRYHLRQHRLTAGSSRILENESANPATAAASLRSVYRLQQALIRREAPKWWLRFAPLVLARLRCSAEGAFGMRIADAELEGQVPVARDQPHLLGIIRLLCNGWHPDPV
jgi:glycosyltransferase involved in cell wall biosynthesis